MKKLLIIFIALFIAGCSKGSIPMTGLLEPEESNIRLPIESYGEYPSNYQKILKDFLQNELVNHETAKIEFINKPKQTSISQMGNNYTGYRICLSINSKNNKSIYTGYKTHLFVINNSQVNLHLFDSGLLKIPFELCVDRNISDSIFLNDIPDQPVEIKIDEMDTIDLSEPDDRNQDSKNNYILCKIPNKERTFYFNEFKKILVESIGINEVKYKDVKFSTTHILGSNDFEEILINRVSGSLIVTTEDKSPVSGSCEILDAKKF